MSKPPKPLLAIKRVYDPAEPQDGCRLLVERLWPRGIRKEALKQDGWLRDVAPSTELRKWFNHDPDRWEQFQRRYRAELESNPAAWRPILESLETGPVTLLFSSRDTEHNNVVALRDYLLEQLSRKKDSRRSPTKKPRSS